MSIELTPQQHQALTAQADYPPRVRDPATDMTYVLVPADLYQRFQTLLDNDDPCLMEPLLAELAPEDWEDPANYEGRP